MRRTASEVLRSLETRVAHLEGRVASSSVDYPRDWKPNPSVLRNRSIDGLTSEEKEFFDEVVSSPEIGGQLGAHFDWANYLPRGLKSEWERNGVVDWQDMGYLDGEMVEFLLPTENGCSVVAALADIYNTSKLRFARTFSPAEVEQAVAGAGRLSNVDPALAKLLVEEGDHSDDKIPVKKTQVNAGDLHPSQTTMVLGKSVGMALAMLDGKMDTDLGAIISKDKQIMDGHHRWSAAILAYGSRAKVGGYVANLEGKMLLRVLNIVTKGKFSGRNGNAGSGDIAQYTPKAIADELNRLVREGSPHMSAEKVQSILTDNFGSVENAIETMSDHVKQMSKRVPSWAPDRVEMPVINPDEVPEVASKLLSTGEVLWNPPYKELKTASEQQRRRRNRIFY